MKNLLLLRVTVFGVISALALHNQTQAADVQRHEYSRLETFIYDNGRVEQFDNQKDGQIVWRFLSGRKFERNASFFLPITRWNTKQARGQRHFIGNVDKLWPLAPGKAIRFTAITDYKLKKKDKPWDKIQERRTVQNWTCKVKKTEIITVPAGTFDTLPIRCKRYSPSSMRLLQQVDWYYAPDVGHYIRHDAISFFTGNRSSYALLAALPARRANKKRIRAIIKAAKS
jgi:hypothetical protein